MKKAEIIFSTILIPIDYLLLVLAGMSAYFLRYSNIYQENIRQVVFNLSVGDYLKFVLAAALVWIIIFALAGVYSMRFNRKVLAILGRIFFACSTGALIVIVTFFFPENFFLPDSSFWLPGE